MKTLLRIVIASLFIAASAGGLSAAPSSSDVDQLLKAYYEIQQGLADDSLKAGKSAAAALSKHNAAPAELATAAAAVANAPDIKAARDHFQPLSQQMQALVESVGVSSGSVYVARCPMAFGGKGGTWLQNDKTIANPYYGSSMLRCGSVIQELGSGASAVQPGDMHGTH